MKPTPTPSTKPRKTQQRPASLPWACNAWLHGKLARTKADNHGNRRLVFACSDGTRFEVAGIGNDRLDGGGTPVLHLLANVDQVFNADGFWLVYPSSFDGKPSLTLALRSEVQRGEADVMRFAATVKTVEDGNLVLFVGRQGRPGFHFVPLAIPSDLVLPDGLRYQAWVTGSATRQGTQWVLSSINAPAKPSPTGTGTAKPRRRAPPP